MSSEFFQKRSLEIGIFFLALAVLLTVFAGFILNKKIAQKIELRENQVSSLIRELGEVREENIFLAEKVKNNDVNFEALNRTFHEATREKGETREHDVFSAKQISVPVVEAAIFQEESKEEDRVFDVLIAGHHQKLTDTLMLARFDDENQKIHLISLPRDLSVSGRKINEYYYLYGVSELMNQVERVTGVTVDHYAALNMSAFIKIIDAVSGIDVDVEKEIIDSLYPRGENSYEVYSIAKGMNHLSGEEALKFVRSRSSTSDFDRARRQQKVFMALKERILDLGFLENLDNARAFYESVLSLLETDIGLLEGLQYLQKYQHYAVRVGEVLSTSNFLYPTRNLQGQYILLPHGGDFSRIHQYVYDLGDS